jgi:hypothetical protein
MPLKCFATPHEDAMNNLELCTFERVYVEKKIETARRFRGKKKQSSLYREIGAQTQAMSSVSADEPIEQMNLKFW